MEERRKVLMACPNYWTSPFQVGSHHLAREFVKRGWRVAYVSDPISPLHLLAPQGYRDLKRRWGFYAAGGKWDLGGNLWAFVPAAPVVPHNRPLLRSRAVHRHWHRWLTPQPAARLRRVGFGEVDLLYIDSFTQSFWLDVVPHRRAVYRIADLNRERGRYCAAAEQQERELARRADLVVVPSRELIDYARALGAANVLHLPNGVVCEDFAPDTAPPEIYRSIPRPIAVYVGVMPEWFDFALLRHATLALPEVSFVLIGPDTLARQRLRGIANVHLLGVRPYAELPALLRNADVGLLPFDVNNYPEVVHGLHPQKIYTYAACGLPVVATRWRELEPLAEVITLCDGPESFVQGVRAAVTTAPAAQELAAFARAGSWGRRLETLLEHLELSEVPSP